MHYSTSFIFHSNFLNPFQRIELSTVKSTVIVGAIVASVLIGADSQ